MKSLALLGIGLACLSTLTSAAYADPGACSGYCWAHDPAVVKRASDGTYFRFNTGGGIGIAKSTSLAGSWTYEGNALASGSSIALTGNTDLWVCEPSVVSAACSQSTKLGDFLDAEIYVAIFSMD